MHTKKHLNQAIESRNVYIPLQVSVVIKYFFVFGWLCLQTLRKYCVTSHRMTVSSMTGNYRLPFDKKEKRKEVIQPHLPVRLPCYDLTLIAGDILPRQNRSSYIVDFVGLTGGVCKRQERIHRGIADPRLLPNPRSWSRVADSNPHWESISEICLSSLTCETHCCDSL